MLGKMGQERKQEELASLLELKATPPLENNHFHSTENSHGKAIFKQVSKNPSS